MNQAEGSASTGELISRLSTEVSTLVREELQLAQLEVSGKAKQAGLGAGMMGAAGLLALYGFGTLIAAAVLALALVLDGWAAALIVGAVLLAVAAIVALIGKNRVSQAGTPVPQKAVDSVKADLDAVRHHGRNS